MLIFQVKYNESDSENSPTHFGVRIRRKGFMDAESAEALSVFVDNMASEMLSPHKVARDKEADEFVSTLTPGAQNAIHAASFAWGYENATKYLKNAMKLEEVKNADNMVEKSKAVIESMSVQAGQNEKSSEVSKFVWGYYNEDLKDTQAQSGKSEAITEKSRAGEAEKEHERQQENMRQSLSTPAQEAVVSSICAETLSPALIYCAGAHQEAEFMQEQRMAEQKREELAKLISPEHVKAAHRAGTGEEKAREIAVESAALALARRDEEMAEFEKAEKQLKGAISAIDKFPEGEREIPKKIAAMLPAEIARYIIAHEKKLARRKALRAQLSKWAAFSLASRKALAAMPSPRLIKLASLSSFLRLGK
ncbi:MAG: hypothetical protein WCT52_01355 [Candidatus Micrarchaeia archaeon]